MMEAIKVSQNWVQQVVIAHNFCPFAKKEFDAGSIHYQVYDGHDIESALETVIAECERLDQHSSGDARIETTLIIFPELLTSFDDFLDFLDMASELLQMQGYEGVYQLASFHPDYCFDGEDESDAANYTNRSPLPMLHLIREVSLEKALASYPSPETIPEKNINNARQLGKSYFDELIAACKNTGKGK